MSLTLSKELSASQKEKIKSSGGMASGGIGGGQENIVQKSVEDAEPLVYDPQKVKTLFFFFFSDLSSPFNCFYICAYMHMCICIS